MVFHFLFDENFQILEKSYFIASQNSNDFTETIVDSVLVGSQIWAEVAWSVKTAQEQLNFYIKNCQLTIAQENQNVIKAGFISENCYSSALGVRKIGKGFMSAQNSRFLFQAMSSSNASTAEGA